MRGMKFFIAVAMTSAVFAVGCGGISSQEEGGTAPNFTLPDLKGQPVELAQYKGKVIILDFFADWCPPCRQEIPDFIALQKEYGARAFTMIGVAVSARTTVKQYAEKTGINYPVLIDDGTVGALYGGIRSIPTTFVIDKEGRIAKKYIGYRPRGTFEADIKALL